MQTKIEFWYKIVTPVPMDSEILSFVLKLKFCSGFGVLGYCIDSAS
jgi:hypothetical protein